MAAIESACKICGKRRARRPCPGVGGGICPICCGTEREVTVNCPLECAFLQEARQRDPEPEVDPRTFPNSDIRVDEEFLRRNEPLLILLSAAIARTALEPGSGIVDSDVKDALDGLVRTYRTLQSGLVYESRPQNPLAGRVYSSVQDTISDIRKQVEGHGQVRDKDALGILAFLQRLEIQRNNARPKGRAFIDFLRGFFPPDSQGEAGTSSGLIQTV
jgi:hypothetical protein